MKRIAPAVPALAGALAALVPSIAMWGFTVDDALISIRYAQNLVSGAGWRFDVHAAPSDGVTPLPWVPMLAARLRLAAPPSSCLPPWEAASPSASC